MYSIRVRLDENDPNSKVIEGTPKEVFSKIKDMYNDEKTIFLKIEEVMYRLARISHETYNISHSDYLLCAIAQEIEDNLYTNEVRDQNPLNIELNTLPNLITRNIQYCPLSYKTLKFQKYINKIGLSMIKSTPSKNRFINQKLKISKRDVVNVFIKRSEMRKDINKFCLRLRILEKEVFAINEKEFRTPVGITELIQNNPYGDVYRYLEKKKVLFIDSERMIETLQELNFEYTKMHPLAKDFFNGKYVARIFDNSNDESTIEVLRESKNENEKYNIQKETIPVFEPVNNIINTEEKKDDKQVDEQVDQNLSPRDILVDVMKKIGMGKNSKEQFYILKPNSGFYEISYRPLAYAGMIIYEYHLYFNDVALTQIKLFENMFLVPEHLYLKLSLDDKKNELIIKNEKTVKKIGPDFTNRLNQINLGLKGKKRTLDKDLQKRIYQCFKDNYPWYLSEKTENGYSYRSKAYKAAEIIKNK